MTRIEPELWVESPLAAIAFYGGAFGAEVLHQVGEGDDSVARLEVQGARFWVATADLSSGRPAPPQIDGATARFLLDVPDPDEVFHQALAVGAREVSPVHEEHGWIVGRVTDPFGHEWEIARPAEDPDPGRAARAST